MGIGSLFSHKAEQQLAAQKAAAAAELAAKNQVRDAAVTALRDKLAVTPESDVKMIMDSFQRSNELVYSSGASYAWGNQNSAVRALLNKEVYGEKRWEIFPEEQVTKMAGSVNSETLQTLFKTHSATETDFHLNLTRSLVAPVSPDKAANELYAGHTLLIHDKVTHERLPVSNYNELMTATRAFLGIK